MKTNTNFDEEFKKIEKLHWLPWVGDNYFNLHNDQKLIVVGNSHYAWDEGDVDENEGVRLMLDKEDFTRQDVNKTGMKEGWWKEGKDTIPPRVTNIEKLFSIDSSDLKQKQLFWQSICYFNLIQRPLKSRKDIDKGQPQDYLNGWKVFYKVTDILKPAYCLFIGVAAANHFSSDPANKNNYSSDRLKSEMKLNKTNGTYPRKMILKNNKGQLINMLFIKHTSKYFSPMLWKILMDEEFKGYKKNQGIKIVK